MVYVTPFLASDKQPTAPSTDSGFPTLDTAVEVMGPDYLYRDRRMVIYGPDEERVAFSDFVFFIESDSKCL